MKTFLKHASLAAAVGMLAMPASASAQFLYANGIAPTQGTGLGAVLTILTLQSQGSDPTGESGCIGVNNSTSGCGFADNTVQQSSTNRFVSELTGLTAGNLGIVLNFSEPGSGNEPAQLEQLILKLYSAAGATLFTANLAPVPIFYASTEQGTGGQGYLFQLDPTAQASLAAVLNSPGAYFGLGSSLTQVNAGLETFNIGAFQETSTVPEPASMVLLGTGLLGVIGVARRRRNKVA